MDEDVVKMFRLSSGEDIIAKVLGYDDENYVLYNPMNVMIKSKNNNSTLISAYSVHDIIFSLSFIYSLTKYESYSRYV